MRLYIRHVTLSTGDVRDSYASEIGDAALSVCRALIERALRGQIVESVPLPGVPGYSLHVRATARCLTARVYADGAPSILVVTIGIATHSRCGSRLWRALHTCGADPVPVVTDPERCPPEPWVAAALDVGIAQYPDAVQCLGDFERCLAWAWIGRVAALRELGVTDTKANNNTPASMRPKVPPLRTP